MLKVEKTLFAAAFAQALPEFGAPEIPMQRAADAVLAFRRGHTKAKAYASVLTPEQREIVMEFANYDDFDGF